LTTFKLALKKKVMKKSLIIVCLSFVFYNISAQSVKIGDQIWSTKNLNVNKFRNGVIIPEAKSDYDWNTYNEKYQAAWCYYNYDSKNGVKYGKLYNFYAINDNKGICPSGWHVPSIEEWLLLITNVGDTSNLNGSGLSLALERAAKKIVSESEWNIDSIPFHSNHISFNESGFSAVPSGMKRSISSPSGSFEGIGTESTWWSSTFKDYYNAFGITVTKNYNGNLSLSPKKKQSWKQGYSIRCLKD